jgi:hypothetical protein
MRSTRIVGAVLILSGSIGLTLGADRAAAQGPAGSGAGAAVQDSSRSYNPLSWVKKDSNHPADGPALRSDLEQKLTPILQGQGLLPAEVTATVACTPFTTLVGCLEVIHVSHNLGLDFNCVRAGVTGVLTSADVSGCKVASAEKAQWLDNVVHQLKPEANAKQARKDAEQQAMGDLKGVGA